MKNKWNELNYQMYLDAKQFTHTYVPTYGAFYDFINSYEGKVYCLPVHPGYHIHAGEIVAINGSGEAFPCDMMPYIDEDTAIVGGVAGIAAASMVILTECREEKEIVFVLEKGQLKIENSCDPACRITEKDISGPCFLETDGTVTNDSNKMFCGMVTGVEDGYVYVYVHLNWEE